MRAALTLLTLLASIPAFAAPDYAREQRWSEEITPAIVVGDPVFLAQKNGHKFLCIYTEATAAKMAVLIVHGMGVQPDWGMIGTLRQRLPDYGYTTLSCQMPVLAAEAKADAYVDTFSDAIERLQLALAYLQTRGYRQIALASHSMGSRMAQAYMLRKPAGIAAWAALGMPDAEHSYQGVKAPVLDLYGSRDLPQVIAGASGRRIALSANAHSRQVEIPNADHFYAGREDAMVKAVVDFLGSLQ